MVNWKISNYDYYRDYTDQNPEFWEYLRENAPVAHVESFGGYYLVSRYDDVNRLLRAHERFVSRYGTALSSGPTLDLPESPMIPIETDPPYTGQLRRLISRAMAPAPMESRADEVLGIARRLLDAIPSERFDFVEAFADPFPREVTMRVIGFDLDDLAEIREWLWIRSNLPRDRPEVAEAQSLIDEYLLGVMRSRRREESRNDLISLIAFGEVDGEQLPEKAAASFLKNLLVGALGTTTKTLTHGLHALAVQSELAAALRADEGLWSTAVDEILRYTCVIHGFGRTVAADTELRGCPMRRGDRVRPLLASANRDSEVFEKPGELILDRAPNPHLAFGQGAHKCVGQHLARVMIRVALKEILERYEVIALDDEVGISMLAMESGSAMSNLPVRVVRRVS